MNKRLEELKGEITKGYGCMQAKYINIGFDKAIAELMPRVERLVDTVKCSEPEMVTGFNSYNIEVDAFTDCGKCKQCKALTEWREFMGEGK